METEQVSTFKHKRRNQSAIKSPMGGAKATELFQAQTHLYRHLYSSFTSICLKWAVQFGIPDLIHNHGQPITLAELVSALQVPPAKASYVNRIMPLLAHDGFFAITNSYDSNEEEEEEEEEEETYALTPSSELLVKGSDYCLSSMVKIAANRSGNALCRRITKMIQGDEATLAESMSGEWRGKGASFYEIVNDNNPIASLFSEAMASDSQMLKLALRDCKPFFEKLDSIVDVGGGNGSTAKILSEAFPDLKFIVLDLPEVVANLSDSKNLSYVGGNMFKSIPQADAVLLKWILHNWSDDDCLKILAKCKEAISEKGREGKVIIIDIVINEKEDGHEMTETKLLFDLVMMTYFNGKERNEREWVKLFLKAGFKDYKIFPIFGLRSLIELYP